MRKTIMSLMLIGMIAGCNIFDWTSAPKDEAFFDGLRLFNEGNFSAAKGKFAEAMKADPLRSDFRYYHAKAVIFEANLNYFGLAQDLVKIDTSSVNDVRLPLYNKEPNMNLDEDVAYKNKLYQASLICHGDIAPIYQEQTHGDIQARDIYFDYAIVSMTLAILRLRDTNGDGQITVDDFYFSIRKTGDGKYTFDLLAVRNYLSSAENRQAFNRTLLKSVDFLSDGIFSLFKIFHQDSKFFSPQQLTTLLENIRTAANRYQMIDGKDNDGDGRVDEEILNGLDDDGDGWVDEDVGVIP